MKLLFLMELVKEKIFTNERPNRNLVTTVGMCKATKRQDL